MTLLTTLFINLGHSIHIQSMQPIMTLSSSFCFCSFLFALCLSHVRTLCWLWMYSKPFKDSPVSYTTNVLKLSSLFNTEKIEYPSRDGPQSQSQWQSPRGSPANQPVTQPPTARSYWPQDSRDCDCKIRGFLYSLRRPYPIGTAPSREALGPRT